MSTVSVPLPRILRQITWIMSGGGVPLCDGTLTSRFTARGQMPHEHHLARQLRSAASNSRQSAGRSLQRCTSVSAESLPFSPRKQSTVDLVLSSGFLAFAGHAGFLAAVEEAEVSVGGVMGTSSGALAGSLFAAGYSAQEVAQELSRVPPIQLLRASCRPWQGLWDLRGVIARLSEVLPPTFDDLERPFAVGVVDKGGSHRVVSSGPLASAVAASAAVPLIFRPVSIPGTGNGFLDGGMVDRVGLQPWRNHRQHQQRRLDDRSSDGSSASPAAAPHAVVHLIGRSSPFSGSDDVHSSGEEDVTIINCPRSRASFLDLGAFEQQYDAARLNGLAALQATCFEFSDVLVPGKLADHHTL